MLEDGHPGLGPDRHALQSAGQCLDEVADTQGLEDRPEKRQRPVGVLSSPCHIDGFAASFVVLPEQDIRGKPEEEAPITGVIQCQILARFAISYCRVIWGCLALDCLQEI